ncbi:phage tail sheath C-terminal domain-containing protein, partial [Clostridium sp. CF012]|uniref:phage tail sheath C-terminal domain-containing protein n=1 Tax=Clostridium sp. CF012 TaxID=2843319 RepID=UPI001C0AB067
ILILRDSTDITFKTKEYKLLTEVVADILKYTPENLQYIKDAMVGAPNLVTVVRIDILGTIASALTLVATLKSGWTSTVGEKIDYEAIPTWTEQIREQKKTYKSIVTDTTVLPDNEGVVDLFKTKVTFKDARGEQDSEEIIPTLLGLLAGANVKRGATYMIVPNLKSVIEPMDVNAEIKKGKFVLINDDGVVKIALGINSLTTFKTDLIDTTEKTEDFSSIEIIEAMDMILDDTTKTFKNDFVSKYKNNLDNQMIFISAKNGYLKTLAEEEVLDKNYNNTSFINVA